MACVLPYGVSVLNPSEFCAPILSSREIQNGPSGPVGGKPLRQRPTSANADLLGKWPARPCWITMSRRKSK